MIHYVLIVLGIVLLYYGGELLVTHAVKLARLWGVSPLAVGLTVVAFATSSPELAATTTALLKGSPTASLGNVIGSNIANLGLILGISGIISTLVTTIAFIKREVTFMIVSSFFLVYICWDGVISRIEGGILLALLVGFTAIVLLLSKQKELIAESEKMVPVGLESGDSMWKSLLGVAIGIALLVGGANFLVEGAIHIARNFGVPERIIGLTLLALGTSLPELASCVVAAYRKEGDIILGNVVGSNIFNILCVLGLAVMIKPIEFNPSEVMIDLGVMMAFTIISLPFLATGLRLRRREGVTLLVGYLAYIVYLYLSLPKAVPAP